ncbi:hypothetical protein PHYBOEH_008404 [Phytophthora boehmeriae]|uniref:FYVE-type domain-containing protein n=1 Tax=Phytophthora boehmeriae TaxID=109152 RepID=A0A8T1X1M7_9STRA|nr:hypothetical protein PHYBOEH_008404 [Phytophthora boehmeriae]
MKREKLQVFSQQPLHERRKSSSVGERGWRRRRFKRSEDTEVGAALADMPTLLLVGTIKGSLNDVMYGVLNPTVDAMRLKSSYVGDKFAACAVLATLFKPTKREPFRSHTLKWLEGDHPYIFRPIVKNRDFVFMEATGFTQLADGEAVGYHVMHSVTFPGACPMNGNIRAHMAVCAFYRQLSDGVVEVFTKTTANPGGHVAPGIAVKYGATALMSAQNLADCAQAKKLAWMTARFGRSTSTTSTTSTASTTSSSSSNRISHLPIRARHNVNVRVCFNCEERVSLLSRRDLCSLCSRSSCSACNVKKELSFISKDGSLLKHNMRFCGACIKDVMNLDARVIACEEFGASRSEDNPRRSRLTAHLEGLTASDPNVVVLRPSVLGS